MLKVLLAAVIVAAESVSVAHAADLMDVYRLAKENDPTLQKAAATRQVVRENKPLAMSALLPHLSAGAQYQRQKSSGDESFYDSETGRFITPSTSGDSTNKSYDVQLNQPLFHWADWASLGEAGEQVAQAEVNYHVAQQDLIVRLAQAYFNVLAAKDTLRAAQGTQAALIKQLEQAKKKYAVGLSAVTDRQEVQAASDQAHAEVIADRQALINAEDALLAITGVRFGELREPVRDLPLKSPQPANAQDWIDRAIRQNLNLVSSRLDAKIAAREVDVQRAARYPTLDLSLAHNYSNRDNNATLNGVPNPRITQSTGNSIQLQFSLPIYSGGAIAARSRQAKYRHVEAEAQTHIVARQVKQKTRDAFLGVLTGISKVKALKQAVVSAKTALQASQAGLNIGTRTTVDVLTARKNLLSARTNYAQSRYQYLVDGLLLEQAAGALTVKDIESINRYLTRKEPPPADKAKADTPPQAVGQTHSH